MKQVAKRSSAFLLFLAFVGIGSVMSARQLQNSPWPMFGQNLQHTRRSPYLGPSTPIKRWEFQTGGAVGSSPAIGSDGTVYFGSGDHKVYALNGSIGDKRWEFQAGDYVYSSPAIGSDGTINVGSWDAMIYVNFSPIMGFVSAIL